MLSDPNVDAVLVATPVFLHPEHFEAAVMAGKYIYCEKPVGADVAGCKRVLGEMKLMISYWVLGYMAPVADSSLCGDVLGRMAIETRREVGWEGMMRSA